MRFSRYTKEHWRHIISLRCCNDEEINAAPVFFVLAHQIFVVSSSPQRQTLMHLWCPEGPWDQIQHLTRPAQFLGRWLLFIWVLAFCHNSCENWIENKAPCFLKASSTKLGTGLVLIPAAQGSQRSVASCASVLLLFYGYWANEHNMQQSILLQAINHQ